MSNKSIKLIQKFVHYQYGNDNDVKELKKKYKNMNCIEKTKENARMKEILHV